MEGESRKENLCTRVLTCSFCRVGKACTRQQDEATTRVELPHVRALRRSFPAYHVSSRWFTGDSHGQTKGPRKGGPRLQGGTLSTGLSERLTKNGWTALCVSVGVVVGDTIVLRVGACLARNSEYIDGRPSDKQVHVMLCT